MRVLDTAPGRTTYQRLPGVTFLPRRPERRLPLPRLDVAAFVGFAERGPLHTPVPIEDMGAYRAVFGGDLDVAQADGRTVKAHLPVAVEQFFANGGRRCYVVRVAGRFAEAARLRLPGVVAVAGGPRLAAVSASSPGAWGANLRLAARLAVIPLPFGGPEEPGACTVEDGSVVLRLAAETLRRSTAPALHPGDVLRLRSAGGECWLALVGSVTRQAVNGSTTEKVLLRLATTYRVHASLDASPPEEVTRLELLTVDGACALTSTGPLLPTTDGQALVLDSADAPLVGVGDVLRLYLAGRPAGDLGYLARVEDIQARPGASDVSPPEPAFVALLSPALQLTPEEPLASPPFSLTTLELLRLDLSLRLGDERLPVMADLAFTPGHPRFWGDAVLLGSSPWQRNSAASGSFGRLEAERSMPDAEAAAWHRLLVRDPYDLLSQAGTDAARDTGGRSAQSFNAMAALAGLLAPAGSHLGVSWQAALAASAAGGEVYAEAENERSLVYLPVGLPEVIDEADPAQLRSPAAGRAGADDLAEFDVSVFYDRYLAPPAAPGRSGPGESHRTLLQTAFDLHYLQGRRLRGLHSLLFLDEVAVLAAPDACHDPWQPGEPAPTPVPPAPAPPAETPPCPPVADFAACDRTPAITAVEPHYGPVDAATPVVVHGAGFSSGLAMRLLFGARPAQALQVDSSTALRASAPPGVRPGPVDVTVVNERGSSTLAGAFTYTAASTAPTLPMARRLDPTQRVEDQPFLAVHQALATFCQARGDVVCLLSLPADFGVARCMEWQSALRRRLGLPELGEGFALDEPQEVADLSYAAVYHPWLLVADAQAADRVRPTPPEGAVAGIIAARERRRQAWIAPANEPLASVLGLSPAFSDDEWATLFARRFNLVRPEAGGFFPMSAHTLSGERAWLQLSVRRLMILLRKAALQVGMDFVFQPNHELFRQGVRVALEELLRFLFERGAFAGRSEAEAFRVIADDSVNPRQSVEQGRLVVVIQVAPSQPMEFITVQLIRSGEGELLVQ